MLRVIIRRKFKDSYSGLETDELETVDVECQALEEILKGGGSGESGYDYRSVAGIEILGNT